MEGLVIKSTGSWLEVKCEGIDEPVQCRIRGNFRLKGSRTTNPVAVGDHVTINMNDDGTATITSIAERKNYIIRKASNLSKESQILASNLDLAVLVISLREPFTNTTFIDRFLATAEAYDIPAVIAINKIDLMQSDEDKEFVDAFRTLYESIGYHVVTMSATSDENARGELLEILKGKVSLISGNSGVGKTTIINLLLPELSLKVGDVSASHHTGMHTTTFSEMFPLPEGGYVIDTPGVKGFGTIDFDEGTASNYFREIFAESKNCRFNNCTHTIEPGCAVLKAVKEHRISESRYASYLSVLEDIGEGKYRKPY